MKYLWNRTCLIFRCLSAGEVGGRRKGTLHAQSVLATCKGNPSLIDRTVLAREGTATPAFRTWTLEDTWGSKKDSLQEQGRPETFKMKLLSFEGWWWDVVPMRNYTSEDPSKFYLPIIFGWQRKWSLGAARVGPRGLRSPPGWSTAFVCAQVWDTSSLLLIFRELHVQE